MTPAGGRIGFERQIRVLHRTVDAAIERHAEDVGKAEVIPALAELVEERGREGREQASAALDVASDRVALGVGQRRRVGEDEQPELIEAVRGQEGFVHELERDARFDERVIHAEHVILGAVARRHAGVVGLGLLGVKQRDACEWRFVAEVAFVLEMPLVDPLDGRAASGGRRGRRRTS